MSSGENLTINDSPIINSQLTSSPLLSAPVSAPLTSSPSNVRYSSGLYYNGVKYEWGKYTPPPNYLCFTANTAGSKVKLQKNGNPTVVTLETSTDGSVWTTYSFGTAITLSNIGDKVYFRNTSETTTGFSTSVSDYYGFVISGSIAASGDVTSLINKNCTDTLSGNYCLKSLFISCTSLTTPPELPATTLSNYCYYSMFNGCASLTKTPELPATVLTNSCYGVMFYGCTALTTITELPATTLAPSCYLNMFFGCTSLATLPKLPAITLSNYCYQGMFQYCSKIKLSTTQTGEYQTPYRIPTTGTGTTADSALMNMFANTGGTFTGHPSINTTYYTSNQII